MKYTELFKTIQKEGFDEETALLTTIAQAIHLELKVEEEDVTIPGRFLERMEESIRNVLWEEDQEKIEEILVLESTLHTFDMCRNLKGFGGCVERSLKSLFHEALEKESKIKEK